MSAFTVGLYFLALSAGVSQHPASAGDSVVARYSDSTLVACAVSKAVETAHRYGALEDEFAVSMELSAEKTTVVVEIASLHKRGGGVLVEVNIETCDVLEVLHTQ